MCSNILCEHIAARSGGSDWVAGELIRRIHKVAGEELALDRPRDIVATVRFFSRN
jgi:hypothetical protein